MAQGALGSEDDEGVGLVAERGRAGSGGEGSDSGIGVIG